MHAVGCDAHRSIGRRARGAQTVKYLRLPVLLTIGGRGRNFLCNARLSHALHITSSTVRELTYLVLRVAPRGWQTPYQATYYILSFVRDAEELTGKHDPGCMIRAQGFETSVFGHGLVC